MKESAVDDYEYLGRRYSKSSIYYRGANNTKADWTCAKYKRMLELKSETAFGQSIIAILNRDIDLLVY